MLTHSDLVERAKKILVEYLSGPFQNDKQTINALLTLFDGPDQREADRNHQVTDYSATFTRQISVPVLQRIIHHLHNHKLYQDPKDGPELDKLLRLLVEKLAAKDNGSSPHIPADQEGALALIPVPLLMHTLMFLDSVKARHKLNEGQLAQLLGDLKEVRPLPLDFSSIKPIIEKAAQEIVDSNEEVPNVGMKSIEPLDRAQLVTLLTRHFGHLFHQTKVVEQAVPMEFNAALAQLDSFLREQFGHSTSPYHLARSYLNDIQRARVPRVDMGSAPDWPSEYTRRFDEACKAATSGPNWNKRFVDALNKRGLTLSVAVHPHSAEAYPNGHPQMAPWPFEEEDAWPKNSHIVWSRVDNGSVPNIPGGSGSGYSSGTFHFACIELLRGIINSVSFPTAIENNVRWHNVYSVLEENQLLYLKELLIKGLKERGSITKEDDEVIIRFQTHDGNAASPREVLLNIGGKHFTARQTCEAILRLLGDQRIKKDEYGHGGLTWTERKGEGGWAESGKADQGPKDQRSMMDRTQDDIELKFVMANFMDNAGAAPNRFLHIIPGMRVLSPIDKRQPGEAPVKVTVEQINSRGIIIVHPVQGRRGFQWHTMNEEQTKAIMTIIPE